MHYKTHFQMRREPYTPSDTTTINALTRRTRNENEMWFVFVSCVCVCEDAYCIVHTHTHTDTSSYCQRSRLSGGCSSFCSVSLRKPGKERWKRCIWDAKRERLNECVKQKLAMVSAGGGCVCGGWIDWITFWLRVACTLKCFQGF